jgi:hypothetical protein
MILGINQLPTIELTTTPNIVAHYSGGSGGGTSSKLAVKSPYGVTVNVPESELTVLKPRVSAKDSNQFIIGVYQKLGFYCS